MRIIAAIYFYDSIIHMKLRKIAPPHLHYMHAKDINIAMLVRKTSAIRRIVHVVS